MFSFLSISLALLSTPVPMPVTDYTTTAPAQTNSDVNKIVCKKEEPVGSRLAPKKVCLTVGEWEARAKADRDETERVQMLTPPPH